MAFDSSYGEVEEGKEGATRARLCRRAVPWQGEAWHGCLVPWRGEARRGVVVLSCLIEVEMRHDVMPEGFDW